ncbi:MAG TPA: polysaccharide lyase family 7 protein [Pirellulales bacterium]|nr:polysaccharide lyase family 7 protein [Pirellulales bacterium]
MMLRMLWAVMVLLLSGAAVGFAARLPSEALDLSHWKLTLPTDKSRPGKADEIQQPELARFSDPQWFFPAADGKGVVFRAGCGAPTTKGSKFPRSELREMSGSDGRENASWSTSDTIAHTMVANLAITHLPQAKPHCACAQIHDAKDDLMMVRLEGTKLFVERNKQGDIPLDAQYQLGTFFELKIEAGNGHVRVWYNGAQKMDWEVVRQGCYFKAGCYTQSNRSKGDRPEAYGEVVIRALELDPAPQRLVN